MIYLKGDDFFPEHNFRRPTQELKPKPAPESPRPGAADSGGNAIKSALARQQTREPSSSCGCSRNPAGKIRPSASRALSDA